MQTQFPKIPNVQGRSEGDVRCKPRHTQTSKQMISSENATSRMESWHNLMEAMLRTD